MQDQLFILFSLLVVLNVLGFVFVGWDKKKSIKKEERFPEVSFLLLSVFFASLGVFLALFVFRHKIKKIYFPLGIGVLVIQQSFLMLWLVEKIITKF